MMFYKNLLKKIIFVLVISFISLKIFSVPIEFESHLFKNFITAMKIAYPKNFVSYCFDTSEQLWFIDLKNDELISPEDFKTAEIDNKIKVLLDKTKDSLITFEDFEITKKGIYKAKNKDIPYITFSSKVKNVPFKNVAGVVACYSSENIKSKTTSTKLIVTMTNAKAFNPAISRDFIQALGF